MISVLEVTSSFALKGFCLDLMYSTLDSLGTCLSSVIHNLDYTVKLHAVYILSCPTRHHSSEIDMELETVL